MICQWENVDEKWSRCTNCGTRIYDANPENCHGICRISATREQGDTTGPGTKLKNLLTKAGITTQRVKRLKYYLGMAPSCGCHVREDQLNRFGVWVRRLLLEANSLVRHLFTGCK